MTRAEADAFVSEYDAAMTEYRVFAKMYAGRGRADAAEAAVEVAFDKMNACRERLIDRLCGEEATQPLAGSAR